MARVTAMRMPQWCDDPAELADLWRYLTDLGWPDDGNKPPDPAYFMDQGHKWADAYNQMVHARRAA